MSLQFSLSSLKWNTALHNHYVWSILFLYTCRYTLCLSYIRLYGILYLHVCFRIIFLSMWEHLKFRPSTQVSLFPFRQSTARGLVNKSVTIKDDLIPQSIHTKKKKFDIKKRKLYWSAQITVWRIVYPKTTISRSEQGQYILISTIRAYSCYL